jgi:hypothetical protein
LSLPANGAAHGLPTRVFVYGTIVVISACIGRYEKVQSEECDERCHEAYDAQIRQDEPSCRSR